MHHVYECKGCGKKGEVAFRVNVKNPEKIARASPDTPRPLCIRCAEKRREEVLAERKAEKEAAVAKAKETKRSKAAHAQPATQPEPVSAVPTELGTADIDLNWRWAAYNQIWTQRKPTVEGDYWIWEKGMTVPTMRKVNPLNTTSLMQPFLEKDGFWYLGPCRVPPSPPVAVEQALNDANKRKKKTEDAALAPAPAPAAQETAPAASVS